MWTTVGRYLASPSGMTLLSLSRKLPSTRNRTATSAMLSANSRKHRVAFRGFFRSQGEIVPGAAAGWPKDKAVL